jgi:CheY-like chemotaxis protein
MNTKRLLLVQNDPMLATCFGEALAAIGLDVYVAPNASSALQRLEELVPDLIVIDLVVPGMDGAQLIRKIRNEKGASLPIIVLPTHLEPLALAAHQANASTVLDRFSNPVAAVVNAVETTLGGEASVLRTKTESAGLDSRLAQLRAGLPARLVDLRQSLHELASDHGQGNIANFFQYAHNFAEQTALLNLKAVVTLAYALETLTFDIQGLPEQLNASTLRTLGQGIDLLATLLEKDRWEKVKHPSDARILVVEDDANAQQLITASIELVQLEAVGAATPTASLNNLQGGLFDLVFLDIGLPEMNGFDLCTKVRALPQFEKTPVVFLTGMATFQNRAQSTLSGGNDFIGKPFNVRELGLKALIWVFKGQLGLI